jgi:uncharacterized repeat protein (TIGR01451 family)
MKILKKIRLRKLLDKIIPKPKPVMAFLLLYSFTSFFAPSVVLADFFFGSGGDPFYCAFGGTFGVQYSNLGNGVSYNSGQVQGWGAGSIQGTPVNSVTAVNGFYGDRFDNMRHVAVPPGSTVQVGYWAWNLTGHNVNVPRVDLFTSRSNTNEGDITKLGAGGGYSTVCDAVGGCRSGNLVVIGDQGGFGDDPNGNAGGRVVYSFNTIQPIQQVSYSATPQWSGANLTVRYDLTLRNVSSYNVGNIRVLDNLPSGATYDQTHSFNAGETRTITYTDNWNTSYPLNITNNVQIYDNNTYTESTSRAKSGSQDLSHDAQPGFIWRDDAGAPSGWAAPQGTWASQNFSTFSVSIIPYNFTSSNATVNLAPSVQITKTVSDTDEINVANNTAQNRENITYDVSVTNNGGRVNDVVVTDNYDQNFISINYADGGSDSGDTLTWNIPSLEHGETRIFRVEATIFDLAHGDYSFPNTVTTNIAGSNTSSVTTNVNPRAVLNISKLVTDSDETFVETNTVQGDHYNDDERRLTFSIDYANNGDTDATNVILTDDLTQFASANEIQGVENISGGGTYDSNTNVITWNIGDLPEGGSGNFTFDLILNRTGEPDQSIVNTATIDSEETSPLSDSTTTNILTPQYWLSKTDNTTETNPGEFLTYTITLGNVGTGDGYNLRIEDLLPEHVVLSEESVDPEGNFDGNRTIIWEDTNVDEGLTLNAGQSRTFTYEVQIPLIMPGGTTTLINNVGLTTPTFESEIVTDSTDVLTPILELEKVQDLPEIVAPGQPITYTLNYRNSGTGFSPSTTLIDSIPQHTIFVSFGESNPEVLGTFDSENNAVQWDLGNIQAGQEGSVSFTVVIEIPTPSDTEIRNTAIIYSPVVEVISSEAVTATTNACCMGGFIWDDNDKNGVYDEDEYGIENARIRLRWSASEYLPENEVELYTDQSGHYVYTGLPFYTPLHVTVEMPNGFDEFTTVNEYTLALLPPREDGVPEDYVEDGIRYVTASGCITFLNAGIYRDIVIADTGDSILIPIGLGISLIGVGVTMLILNFKKRKK